MLEIEIKIPLGREEESNVLRELKKLVRGDNKAEHPSSCIFLGEKSELDYYYQHPCRDFSQTDEALRIRTIQGQFQPNAFEITYKGPKIDSATKTRLEVSIVIETPEKMKTLLSSLGFNMIGRVIKNRKTWKITEERITITIDEVESLGTYLELEILDVEANYEVSKKKLFFWLQKLLKCVELPAIERRSYLELLLTSSLKNGD